jgi:hypothetical protein
MGLCAFHPLFYLREKVLQLRRGALLLNEVHIVSAELQAQPTLDEKADEHHRLRRAEEVDVVSAVEEVAQDLGQLIELTERERSRAVEIEDLAVGVSPRLARLRELAGGGAVFIVEGPVTVLRRCVEETCRPA